MTMRVRPGRFRCAAVPICVLAAGLLLGSGSAARAAETEVRVERVRPQPEKLPTLPFLKANRDFIRARLERIRQVPADLRAEGAEIDPRFLDYQKMLAAIHAARDTMGDAGNLRRRQELLASITELGSLEAQLDRMEQQLVAQRARLGTLQRDFAGEQHTALMVLLRGYPREAPLTEVALTVGDGATLRVPLSPEQRAALEQGGVIEIFHGFVEPRQQVIEVQLTGSAWPAGESGFVTLDPARDRLTFLRLDLSTVQPAPGGTGMRGSTWLHEGENPSGDG
jgi:hypothetical protein